MLNMSFPGSNFKESLVLMCLASHFEFTEGRKMIVGHRGLYYARKILHPFLFLEFRILVEK